MTTNRKSGRSRCTHASHSTTEQDSRYGKCRRLLRAAGAGNGAVMRVLVADAVEAVCNRLKELVREVPGVQLVAVEADTNRFLERMRTTRPHVLLLGTRLEGASSFEALERLRGHLQGVAVVLLCDRLDGQYLYHANALGADYVLELSRDIELLPSLLRQLARTYAKQQDEKRGAVNGD